MTIEIPELEEIRDSLQRIENQLAGQAEDKGQTREDRVMTVTEAAEFLGFSPLTLYRLLSRREVRHYRVGKRILLRMSDVEEWLEGKKVEAVPDRAHKRGR